MKNRINVTKRLFSFILCMSLIITLLPVSAFADEQDDNNGNIYVYSESCPAEIIRFAQERFTSLLSSHLEANAVEEPIELFTLGMGFKVEAVDSNVIIYHLPIYLDNSIYAIMSIADDNNNYYSQIEKGMLTEKLNIMKDDANIENPISFISYMGGFYAVTNDKVEPLIPDIDNTDAVKSIAPPKEKKGHSQSSIINISERVPTGIQYSISAAKASNPLKVPCIAQTEDGSFSSEQKEWCGAACTASIINFLKGKSLSAKDVTIEALGSAKNEGITNSQVIKVAKKYSLKPSEVNPLSYTNVKGQIDNGKPIYMQLQRSAGTEKNIMVSFFADIAKLNTQL